MDFVLKKSTHWPNTVMPYFISKVLNMDKYQVDWLCEHMGHTADVHKIHYRQMSGLVERVQMTKLFLVQDNNLSQRFKGKKLDEIDLSGQ